MKFPPPASLVFMAYATGKISAKEALAVLRIEEKESKHDTE